MGVKEREIDPRQRRLTCRYIYQSERDFPHLGRRITGQVDRPELKHFHNPMPSKRSQPSKSISAERAPKRKKTTKVECVWLQANALAYHRERHESGPRDNTVVQGPPVETAQEVNGLNEGAFAVICTLGFRC